MTGCEPHLRSILEKFRKAREKVGNATHGYGEDRLELSNTRKKIQGWTFRYTKKWRNGKERVQWALHSRKALDTLVSGIRDHLDELIEVFPDIQPEQIRHCGRDVEELEQSELQLLKDVVQDDDDIMAKAIAKEIERRAQGSHLYSGDFDFETEETSKNRVGDDIATGARPSGSGHVYSGKFKTRGPGANSFGNNYSE